MRIAVFASAYEPSLGGVEELVKQLALAYQRQGHEVIVLTNQWPRELPRDEVLDGVRVFRLPFRSPVDTLKSRATYGLTTRLVSRRVRKILARHGTDVIHVQCISTNGLYAMRASRQMRIPIVATAQGELTMDASRLFQRDRRAQAWLRDIATHADAFTACSAKTLRDVEDFVGRKFGDRGAVVFNGTDVQLFATAGPYRRDRPYVFALGRLVPQKGFDILMRAIARISDEVPIDLVLAGDGPLEPQLRALALELGVADRVEFFGRANRHEAAALMRGARAVVLPSRADEGLPLVSVEAMASGTPLVATRTGGIEEAATDRLHALLVDMEDEAALTHGLVEVLSDDEFGKRLGRAAQERAGRFDWGELAAEYLSVFTRAIGSSSMNSSSKDHGSAHFT